MISLRGPRALVLSLGLVASTAAAVGLSPDSAPARSRSPVTLVEAQSRITLAGARAALDAAVERARSLGASPSIAVVDDGGHLVCFVRLDGGFPAGSGVSEGKARTAAIFRKSTSAFEDSINNGRTAMAGLEGVTPLRGGVPIRFKDCVVGGIGVSGASSAEEDETIAAAGAAAFANDAPNR